ncbi:MAG: PhoH family protein, partial [Clostridia bacterium]|nr:PhoH family protein [Clostridia bacterium]
MYEQHINIDRMEQAIGLFGSLDHNIRLIEKAFSVTISVRNGEMKIAGEAEAVSQAVMVVQGLLSLLNSGEVLNDQNVEYVIAMVKDGQEDRLAKLADRDCICITSKGRPVKPKTIGQQNYVQAIRDNTVVLAVGPAGTGKTYLAV